jgi:HlyD family secretion protein
MTSSMTPIRLPARLCLILALASVAAACDKPAPKAAPPIQPSVVVDKVQARDMQSRLKLAGLLVAREEATISTELSGYRVSRVLVDEGDWVHAGQPVAMLDDTLLRSQIVRQDAIVAQQSVAAERAQQEAERVKGLDAAGALSGEAVAERVLAARAAKAFLAQAKADLADLKIRQGLMIVRAPVSGRVLERLVKPGEVVSPGAAMFRAARDGLVELDAETPEARLDAVRENGPVEVILPSGAVIAGRVRLVSPQVDSQTRLGRLRISLPLRTDLRPGAFAEARLVTGARSVRAVPASAVQYDADGAALLVVDNDHRVQRRSTRTGLRDGGLVEIVDGPPVGAMVVLRGGALLLAGDKVLPVPAGGAVR